jgi:hypothetical protein
MNSRQPSWRSPRIDADAVRNVGARCIEAVSVADAKNVAASTAIASAGLPAATRIAPMAGPAIWSTLFASPISALASCSRASLAACLMSPIWAGRENAAATPNTVWRKAIFQTSAVPLNSRIAVRTCAEPLMTSLPTRIVRRGIRSANTPPSRSRMTIGTSRASMTMPRSVALPNPSTANASATFDMPEPRLEIAVAAR